ncbi:hypothetical protein OH76DRAFT_1407837 [Lentinus brumalis]|uniref:DNA repair protein Rad26 n=1 Tax=Lentinus brumalis TaxID=2498619 RepID=A0A371CZD9_9APHY|nr:hypothetical protein OH76DRAFT_1407837 [Polyporus brumalis]
MDGSDDYFFGDDDFVLDEKTIAALDLEEHKWRQQQTQATTSGQRRPVSREARQPSPKRRKTSHEATPEGLIAQIRAVTVGDDYDEDLPDISIIGDGAYNLPVAQRASANALAAQARGAQQSHPHASTSNHRPARVPGYPPRAPPPAPPQRRASSGSASDAHGSGQSQGSSTGGRPPQRNRPPRQHSTLSSVQAALADFVPQASAAVPAPTPPPKVPLSRASPAAGPSRITHAAARQQGGLASSSAVVRPALRTPPVAGPAPASVTRTTRGTSPSVSLPQQRRQSIPAAGPSRQQRASPSVPPQPPPQPPYQPPLSQGQSDRNLRIEVEMLKAQLEELVKAQQKSTKDLEEALNVRYAKEGEVSILRKSIEKAAKDHAAEVARIKAAKEEAEAMQVQIRKEMREELERVKTQYLFKQHELETSARKTPWSTKIRRTEHFPPPTPVSASTQRRQVAEEQPPLQTPSRSRAGLDLSVSPKWQHRKKIVHIPESPPKKPVKLPGFVNAFAPTSSNLRLDLSQALQSTQVGRKGKERAKVAYDFSEAQNEELFFNPPPPSNEDRSQEPLSQPSSSAVSGPRDDVSMDEAEAEAQTQSSPPASSAEPVVVASESQDVEMKETQKQAEPVAPGEPIEAVEPLLNPDWTRELQRILLLHKYRTAEHSTLQRLIDYEVPSTASSEQVQAYGKCIVRLMDILGAIAAKPQDTEYTCREVATTLCSIGQVLRHTQSLGLLAGLIDILKMLALLIPSFVPMMLAPSGVPGSAGSPPEILDLLVEIIRSALNPRVPRQGEDWSMLGEEALGLLDAIIWYIPPDLVQRLTYFICAPNVLDIFADPKQPIWLTQRAARILALLASYKDLHKYFLTLQASDDANSVNAPVASYRISYLEKLAIMLVDKERDGPEYQSLRLSVVHLLSALLVHDDSTTRAILVHSDTILPAVIHYAYHLTGPLYEEDQDFLESPKLVTWSIDMTMRVVPLLHNLLKGCDFDAMRLKLIPPNDNTNQNHRKKTFKSVFHMLTVGLGRLGYAEPPQEISEADRKKLDKLDRLARGTLELVVDGPEMESIWEAFQPDESKSAASRPASTRSRRNPQQNDEEIES